MTTKLDGEGDSDLRFVRIKTTTTLKIHGSSFFGTVKVRWTATRSTDSECHDSAAYKIKITKCPFGRETFSLLTLCVQSAYHRTKIYSVSPRSADVRIFPYGTKSPAPFTNPIELPKASDDDKELVGGEIYMVSFSGWSCTLVAQTLDRTCIGETVWEDTPPIQTYQNHSNMPPGGTTEK